ncbi:DUF6894 family protein [Methylobacterium brachythecii]|uniref:DUF6894 domain-containing protein n=1 Tax=Methylobacterium brachythecii TaxID=1176177 RepID=A0A7W6AJ66_9HYPH|nr:hypothetical protein [Methylobacterium brachythecii]MBB3903658.1 hypothetical protein [Methylobacterium brachythecii]GLS44229.1 hypothetical protein GCM10007884_22170 [Methylobacterium brachythecii]
MPRFFFNVQDGQTIMDHKGVDLSDWSTARLHAISIVGRILAEEPERIAVDEDWLLEVSDSTGLILFRLDFHVTASPAVRGGKLKKEVF